MTEQQANRQVICAQEIKDQKYYQIFDYIRKTTKHTSSLATEDTDIFENNSCVKRPKKIAKENRQSSAQFYL